MQIYISYFYQIRNFEKYMIPISTALSDPSWYHDNKGNNHVFLDKNGILNGIRCPLLAPGSQCQGLCKGKEYCKNNSNNCNFLKTYTKQLEQIDFGALIDAFKNLIEKYKRKKLCQEEPCIVLIVYETPDNPCSERYSLIDYFNSKGIECKELEYPIQKIAIKNQNFNF